MAPTHTFEHSSTRNGKEQSQASVHFTNDASLKISNITHNTVTSMFLQLEQNNRIVFNGVQNSYRKRRDGLNYLGLTLFTGHRQLRNHQFLSVTQIWLLKIGSMRFNNAYNFTLIRLST